MPFWTYNYLFILQKKLPYKLHTIHKIKNSLSSMYFATNGSSSWASSFQDLLTEIKNHHLGKLSSKHNIIWINSWGKRQIVNAKQSPRIKMYLALRQVFANKYKKTLLNLARLLRSVFE